MVPPLEKLTSIELRDPDRNLSRPAEEADPELFGERYLDLPDPAGRTGNAHALDTALRAGDRKLLFAHKPTGLRQVRVLRELMPLPEQRLHVLLPEVDVMRRDLNRCFCASSTLLRQEPLNLAL